MTRAKTKRSARKTATYSVTDAVRHADALRADKKPNEALAVLHRAARRFPDRWEPRLEIAKIAMAQWSDKSAIQKKLTPALRLLRTHLAKNPHDHVAAYELARARYHVAIYPFFNTAQAKLALAAVDALEAIAPGRYPDVHELRARLFDDTLMYAKLTTAQRLATLRAAVAALEHAPAKFGERRAAYAAELERSTSTHDVDAAFESFNALENAHRHKAALVAIEQILTKYRDRLGHRLDDALYQRATLLDEHGLGTRKQIEGAWGDVLERGDSSSSKSEARGRLGLFALEAFERTRKRVLLDEAREHLAAHAKDAVYPDTELLYALAKAHAHAGDGDQTLAALHDVFKRRRELARFRARAKKDAAFRDLAGSNPKLAKLLAR